MDRRKIEDYIQDYSEIKAYHDSFCVKLKDLLISILDNSKIPYHVIESRVKTISSFKEKILRDGKNYVNPIDEITDLTGLRIILYYLKDVEKVVSIIRNEFQVDNEKSIDKKRLLKENEFGYLSVHLIVSLNKSRISLPEWNYVHNLKAEIQIRTVLQHSWASISHTLQYKRESDIPAQFRRKLNRLAGLLELADEEFENLKNEQFELGKRISKSLEKNRFDLPVDMLSVEDYLRKNNILSMIEDAMDTNENLVYDPLPEDIEEKDSNPVSQLIIVLNYFKIDSIEKFDNLLSKNKYKIKSFFDTIVPKDAEAFGGRLETFLVIFILGLLSKNGSDIVRIYKKLGWSESFLLRELIEKGINTANNL